jgi:hypothetical protein
LPLLVGETELVGVVCCVHREFFSTFLLPVYALRRRRVAGCYVQRFVVAF